MLMPLLGLAALAVGATADAPNWVAQIGLGNNTFPGGGDDTCNYFGAFEGSVDDYPDAWDVADHAHWVHCLYLAFHGDQNGDNPTYPLNGLCWDIREPYDGFYKVWKMKAGGPDEGYTYDLYYDFEAFEQYGYALPDGWVCRLDMDGEINSENYLDLSLYEVDLDHREGYVVTGLPQTGDRQTWYLIAGIPEPPLAQLGGLVLAAGCIIRGLCGR